MASWTPEAWQALHVEVTVEGCPSVVRVRCGLKAAWALVIRLSFHRRVKPVGAEQACPMESPQIKSLPFPGAQRGKRESKAKDAGTELPPCGRSD